MTPEERQRNARPETSNSVSGGVLHGPVLQVGNHYGNLILPGHAPPYVLEPTSWPVARDWGAITAGVKKAPPIVKGGNIPPYASRDIDATLRKRLAATALSGGLLLLLGHSAAGKTRAAYEALLATLPDYRVATPTIAQDLAPILETIRRTNTKTVVWLDDLQYFVGPEGLDQNLLRTCREHSIPILATMRFERYKVFNPITRDENSPEEIDSAKHQKARIGAHVLEMAETIEIPLIWSRAELSRARELSDSRIDGAIAHHEKYGIAEYLAVGPLLWEEWRISWEVGGQPRGAALVGAAVGLARTGLPGPYPLQLIIDLHEHYINPRCFSRLEPLAEALAWAMARRLDVTGPLIPVSETKCNVFDYLVDGVERLIPRPPVVDATWLAAAKQASGQDQLMNLAICAAEAATPASLAVAESTWLAMLEAEDDETPMVEYNLGVLYSELGDIQKSKQFFFSSAKKGNEYSAYNVSILLQQEGRSRKSLKLMKKAAAKNYPPAFLSMGVKMEERGDQPAAKEWYRRGIALGDHQSATNLGNILAKCGQYPEAISWYRHADAHGDKHATYNIGRFHHKQGRFNLAEQWYLRAARRGSHEAEMNIGVLRKKSGDIEGAIRWFQQAAEGGVAAAACNLGNLFSELNDEAAAIRWYERAAEEDHIPSLHALSKIALAADRPAEAIKWLERAAMMGDKDGAGTLGELLFDQGRESDAIRHLTVAAEAGNSDAAYNLGVLCVRRQDTHEAARWYRQAAEDGDAEAASNLAEVMFHLGQARSAIWWMERSVKMRNNPRGRSFPATSAGARS